MTERKAWTKEEDQALLDIIQIKKIKKWSAVSKAMETQYDIFGRTGKQCRERWHNQLDPTIKNTQWTHEQEIILFQNHDKFGNKWARISQQIQGRTDNCVKNHFYSTLRRAFRRLNNFITLNKQRLSFKEIKPVILSKLVAAAEDKFNKKLKLASQIITKSTQIKNRLLPFSKEVQNTSHDNAEMQSLIKQILLFSKSYKRKKSKKSKQSEDQQDFGQQEQQISIKDESQKQETPVQDEYLQKKQEIIIQNIPLKQQHKNLFSFNSCEVVHENKQMSQSKQYGAFELIHRPQSKVLQQQHSAQLGMIKRGSNLSNWSVFLKLPSMHQRISQLSMSHDALIFDQPINLVRNNIFGCDVQQLND